MRKFIRILENGDYKQSFNSSSNLGDCTKKKAAVHEFQTNYIEEKFNAVEDATIRQNNADILPQMLTNNELKDSLILKENIEHENNREKERTKPMLDDYLRDDINPRTLRSPQH